MRRCTVFPPPVRVCQFYGQFDRSSSVITIFLMRSKLAWHLCVSRKISSSWFTHRVPHAAFRIVLQLSANFYAPTLSSAPAGVVFERAPVLGLEFLVFNTSNSYPDKRCFQPHSLAHVSGTFTVAEPHFLTSFHRDIRWGTQYQETSELADQHWKTSPRFVGITCTQRRRSP